MSWGGAAVAAVSVAAFIWGTTERQATEAVESVIVQAQSLEQATAAVEAVGGEITHELGIISAVGADVTASAVDRLSRQPELTVHGDRSLQVASTFAEAHFPGLTGATTVHDAGPLGEGVTVAVIDSGVWANRKSGLQKDVSGDARIVAQYDAMVNSEETGDSDSSGHGTHVSSIILSSLTSDSGNHMSMAPDARLVSVKAFDENGAGSYADVIRGLDWVVANKDAHDIRVLNLSFSAAPQSHYWDDPLNQAVMRAWQEGIVVVASAGNIGPDPMSVGVPGNVPYVITVGAMTDSYTPDDPTDDRLTSFSSAGPTYEGFVKPDVVAPGGHIIGSMDKKDHQLALTHPEFSSPDKNMFEMSGTSQSAAVVSGIVALMIQQDPYLTPDEVKYRLMSTAAPAIDGNGALAYTIFQQGAGMVNAYDAVYPTLTG